MQIPRYSSDLKAGRPDLAGAPYGALAAAAAAALAAAALVTQSALPLNHDSAWYLVAARQWLEGDRLYVETAFDPNPPMVVWISAACWHIAALTYVPADGVLRAVVVLVTLAAGGLTHRLLRSSGVGPVHAFGTLAFVSFGLSVPQADFAQRDHFIAAFLLPYTCIAALRVLHRPVPAAASVAGGIALGLACSLKPHYVLLALFLKAYRVVKEPSGWKRLDIEEIAAGATVLLYASMVLALAPGYLLVAAPLAARVYPAYAITHIGVVASTPILTAYLVGALVVFGLMWFAAMTPPARVLVSVFLVSAVASWLVFVLQGTGWSYQSTPARVLLFTTIGLGSGLLAERVLSRRSVMALVTLACLLVAGAGV